jgi:hypothetical protein
MRKRDRVLKKGHQLSTAAATSDFVQRLNHVLRDERGRAFIRHRLVQTELPVIQF